MNKKHYSCLIQRSMHATVSFYPDVIFSHSFILACKLPPQPSRFWSGFTKPELP